MDKMKKILAVLSVTTALTALSLLTVSADEPETPPAEQPAVTEVTELSDTAETALETTVSVSVVTESTEVSETTTDTETTSAVTTQTSITTVVTTARPQVTRMENADAPQGWNSFDGRWYYKDGKKFLTGIKEIDGEYYSFAPSGALKTGWQTVKGLRKFFDSETHSPIYGWIEYMGNTYYTDKEHGKAVGRYTIDGKDYIFSESGIRQTLFVPYEGHVYYCDSEGVLVTPSSENEPIIISDTPYYLKKDGSIKTGWQTTGGIRRYFDPETGKAVYGWLGYLGKLYYVDKEFGKYTGDKSVKGVIYRFGENGILQTGIQAFDTDEGTDYYYYYVDGTMAVDELIRKESDYYYFDINGRALSGWQKLEGGTYYFDPKTRKALTDWQTIDGIKYHFSSKGIMTTGFFIQNGNKYFFDEKGKMVTGFFKYSGDTYYFDKTSGAAAKGWNTIDDSKYFFDQFGVMAQNFYQIEDATYYFGSDGAMRTGWQEINKSKYYFGTNGKMYTYRNVIDNKDYLFGLSGKLITSGNQRMPLKALTQLGQDGGKPFWGDYWGSPWRFEWCACFVSWTAAQCGYAAAGVMPEFISCRVGIEWFQEHKVWKGRNYTPVSGDIVFFDWEPDGVADHVGIVDYCEDGMLYTVEGNSNDMVRQRSYSLDSKNIFGFASPKY